MKHCWVSVGSNSALGLQIATLICFCFGIRSMQTLPIRLTPGQDLRATLDAAEVLLALLPDWQFTREPDAHTGHDELVVRERG